MEFVVRFVNSKKNAICDIKRGYSFSSYALFGTRCEAIEFWSDILNRTIENSEVGYQRGAGYGLRLGGLCGFGFYTIDEAREFASVARGYNGVAWPYAVIFTGKNVGQSDGGEGWMYKPVELVEVIKLVNGD